MDKVPQLGQVISEGQKRDAIHIAIAPVVAGEKLRPGQRIGFTGKDNQVGIDSKSIIGIVDPFLSKSINKGEYFYMLLMPNTITSLRHNWTHPDFAEEEDLALMDKTYMVLRGAPESKKWISEFADRIGSDYHEIMEGAASYLSHGEYLVRGGTFEGMGIPDEFWEHYEKVTNSAIDEDRRGTFLSCSC